MCMQCGFNMFLLDIYEGSKYIWYVEKNFIIEN